MRDYSKEFFLSFKEIQVNSKPPKVEKIQMNTIFFFTNSSNRRINQNHIGGF